MAAGITEDHETIVAELLDALGWVRGDGSPIGPGSAAAAASEVTGMLRRMGSLQRAGSALAGQENLTRNAVDFARAALMAWPR